MCQHYCLLLYISIHYLFLCYTLTYINSITYHGSRTLKSPPKERKSLNTHVVADVCIVGGGFAGLHTAIALAERGLKVGIVIERRSGKTVSIIIIYRPSFISPVFYLSHISLAIFYIFQTSYIKYKNLIY